MSTTGYEIYSRVKSQTMFGLCVLFTLVILSILGLVTGFLAFKGYKGILARPVEVHGTVISVVDAPSDAKWVTISAVRDEGQPPVESRFLVGKQTSIIVDGKDQGPTDRKEKLLPGMVLDLRYSTADPTTATTIRAVPKYVDGVILAARDPFPATYVPAGIHQIWRDLVIPRTLALRRTDGTTAAWFMDPGSPLFAHLHDFGPGTSVRLELSAYNVASVIGMDSSVQAPVAATAEETSSRLIPPILSRDPVSAPLDRDYPGGLRNGIIGTLILIGLASLAGIPVGMLAGIYLAEYSSNSRLAGPVRFIADVLTGVPSIVVGILGYELLVRPVQHFNGWAGSLALAFIMIPLVARTTEEMLLLVPRSYREASVALGATKARTILKVVLPTAAGSVITGVMLAIARVAGETAPLLFTVGGLNALELNPNHPFPALTLQIYKDASNADEQFQRLAWAGILILLALIFVLNVVVRSTAKAMSRTGAAA